jgi:hypothetical protein
MATMTADWLATSEAARRLGLSPERVRQLADVGKLDCERTALGRLFDPQSVADRLASKSREQAESSHR